MIFNKNYLLYVEAQGLGNHQIEMVKKIADPLGISVYELLKNNYAISK